MIPTYLPFFYLLIAVAEGLSPYDGHLGSKSPYVTPKEIPPVPSTCRLIHLDMVSRHGTRYPSGGERTDIEGLLGRYAQAEDLPREWSWLGRMGFLPGASDAGLASTGERDMYFLGQRTYLRHQQVFREKRISGRDVPMMSSGVERSMHSATAFAMGFLEGTGNLTKGKMSLFGIHTLALGTDHLLSPDHACPRWDDPTIPSSPGDAFDVEGYLLEHVNPIASRLTRLLGIAHTAKDVSLVYRACAYSVAIDREDQICSLLHPEDFPHLAYIEDMRHWIKFGAWRPLHRTMGCPLASAIVDGIRGAIASALSPQPTLPLTLTLRFGHSETLLLLFSHMGLFEGGLHPHPNRTFHTGHISPFGANLQVEVYRCGDGPHVRLLLNEVPLSLPHCHGQTLCPSALFLSLWPRPGCAFTEACSRDPLLYGLPPWYHWYVRYLL